MSENKHSARIEIAGGISPEGAEGFNPNDGAIAGLTGHWPCVGRGCRGCIGYSFTDPDATRGLTFATYGKCPPSWSTQVFSAQATATGFAAMRHGGFYRAALDAAGLRSLEQKLVEELYHPSTPGYIPGDRAASRRGGSTIQMFQEYLAVGRMG